MKKIISILVTLALMFGNILYTPFLAFAYPTIKTYEAEGASVSHQIGRIDGAGWSANMAQDSAGYLAYGPYATDIPIGKKVASFIMNIDNNSADNTNIVRLEVNDTTTNEVIAQLKITRQQFGSVYTFQRFDLPFNVQTAGHCFEFRVYWYVTSAVNLDKIEISDKVISVYEAEGASLSHQVGRLDGAGWSANMAQDSAGYLIYGPYATNISIGQKVASFLLMADNNSADNLNVVRIEVSDSTTSTIIAQKEISRQQFSCAYTYQYFDLPFNVQTAGHCFEFRVYWYDTAKITADRIEINDKVLSIYEAEGASIGHQTGRLDGAGWSANTAQDSAGYLTYGPYATDITIGKRTASFLLKIDNNSADNLNVVRLEVSDATTSTVIAQREIARKQFSGADTYQYFDLPFKVQTVGHSYEFRIFWYANSKTTCDRIEINDQTNDILKSSIIMPTYATDDVVIADYVATNSIYCADNTGVVDSTTAIQNALNDCFSAGGGTVWLPAGTYKVTNTINVPSFVTLRGDWRDADSGTGDYGTVIQAEVASGDNGPVLFQIGGSAGVMGLTTYYPNQSASLPVHYNYTFYIPSGSWSTMAGNYMASSVINCTMLNSYRGIGMNALDNTKVHEQSNVKNVKGTVMYQGAVAFNSADVGTWENISFNNSYWANAGTAYNAPPIATLNSWTRAWGTAFTFGDLEWDQFYGINCSDYNIGINIVAGSRISFCGEFLWTNVANTNIAVKVDNIDTRWGMSFLRSVLTGSTKAIQNNTAGYVKICDSTLTGGTTGTVTITAPGTTPTSYGTGTTPKITRAVLYDVTKEPYNAPYALPQIGIPGVDATVKIQQALTDAGNAGGGVVYLPAGWYRINSHLTVPANVELRGCSSVPTRDQSDLSYGTVLLGYEGKGTTTPDTATAMVTLNGNTSGIRGIRFFYPENNPNGSVSAYPYTIRGNGSSLYAINIGLTGVYNGIDFGTNRCDNHFIRKVIGTVYNKNIYVGASTHGWIEGCLTNGSAVCRSNFGVSGWITEANVFTYVINPITRVNEKFIIINGASDEHLLNNFAYGCKNGVTVQAGTTINIFNLGMDNLGTGGYCVVRTAGTVKVMNLMRYNGANSSGTVTIYNPMNL